MAGLVAIGRHWPRLAFWIGMAIGAGFLGGSVLMFASAYRRGDIWDLIIGLMIAFAGLMTIYGGHLARQIGEVEGGLRRRGFD